MPELAEVNIQVEYLRERCEGWKIASFGWHGGQHFKSTREPGQVESFFEGNTIEEITQRGKQVIFRTARGVALSHLMFRGRWSVQDDPFTSNYKHHKELPLDKSRTVWMVTATGARLNFHTPRYQAKLSVFPGIKDPGDVEQLTKLGPEVLITPMTDEVFARVAWDLEYFAGMARKSRQVIKSFLLDQKKQSGLGNMYVCEALYRAGVSPHRKSNALSEAEVERLHAAARELLGEAVRSQLEYDALISVYRRTVDPEGSAVVSEKLGGRDTFWVRGTQV